MPDPRGFLKFGRQALPMRDPVDRIRDFGEVYRAGDLDQLKQQAQRCMGCGVPFCHQGCPLGNPIPEFNDLLQQGRLREAYEELSRTNPFPEFTGKLCPAPCEDACVLKVNDAPVTIKAVEWTVIEQAFENGWVQASPPDQSSGRNVAVVGSGPAGLACAQALRLAGHGVTVHERSDRLGGLIRYGVPDYKMAKSYIDRRIRLLGSIGVKFVASCEIGKDLPLETLCEQFEAVALCVGALKARDIELPGRELEGVRLAMDFLEAQNRASLGEALDAKLDAKGKHVVILGGGDTGADCYGTALRQGAASVTQLNHYTEADGERRSVWPEAQMGKHGFVFEEGGSRDWGVQAVAFRGESQVKGVELYNVWLQGRLRVPVPNSQRTIPADLVLIAIGFEGSQIANLGLGRDGGLIGTDSHYQTSRPGVFAAGDARKGASLIVWAIAEGLNCAAAIDRSLTGKMSLPRAYADAHWDSFAHV